MKKRVPLQVREHLIHFMLGGSINLSSYDVKFLQSIENNIHNKLPLTTNQVALFERLVKKYTRQLAKNGLDEKYVKTLEWTNPIIESIPAYTEAHISIEEDFIFFRAPYKKEFIKAFREVDPNAFIWNKENRRYEASFSTYSLKILVEMAYKYYEVVNHCPITCELLKSLYDYDAVEIWAPTLIKCNGRLIIAGINEVIDKLLGEIELKEDVKTMSLMADYRIDVHSSVLGHSKKLQYASQYSVQADVTELHNIIDLVIELGCDCCYLIGTPINFSPLYHDATIAEKLKDYGIVLKRTSIHRDTKYNDENYKYPVLIQFSLPSSIASSYEHRLKKIFRLTNSAPINVK